MVRSIGMFFTHVHTLTVAPVSSCVSYLSHLASSLSLLAQPGKSDCPVAWRENSATTETNPEMRESFEKRPAWNDC